MPAQSTDAFDVVDTTIADIHAAMRSDAAGRRDHPGENQSWRVPGGGLRLGVRRLP
jgi:hypothetical protein